MRPRDGVETSERDARIVICPSQATINDCIDHGFDARRLRLVPWGVDVQPVSQSDRSGLRARLGITGRFILWAGTIEPRKNLPVLLSAFEGVRHNDVTLVLAGPEGWNEHIDEQVTRLGSRVQRVGFVDPRSLAALQAEAEIFCFPSRQEGFGLPVLEAMGQGTAVITSAGTSTEEVIGDCGIVVEPGNVDELRAAIDRLLESDEERDRLGRAGIDKIGLGALIGLSSDWRADSYFVAEHLSWLERHHWQSRYSLSFPRLRPCTGGLEPAVVMSDRQLAQLICAWRLFSPTLDLSLSTRESATFRNGAVRLGITQMSAESRTQPGGYAEGDKEELEQFAIHDDRPVGEVAAAVRQAGLQPVFKDWEPFLGR